MLKPSRFNRLGLAAAVINGSNRPLRHFDAMEATETSADQAEPALQSTLSTQKSMNRGADRQTRRTDRSSQPCRNYATSNADF